MFISYRSDVINSNETALLKYKAFKNTSVREKKTKTTKDMFVYLVYIVTLCYLVNSPTKPGFLLFITLTFDQSKILERLCVAYVSMFFSLVVKPNTNFIIWFLVTIMSQIVPKSQDVTAKDF